MAAMADHKCVCTQHVEWNVGPGEVPSIKRCPHFRSNIWDIAKYRGALISFACI